MKITFPHMGNMYVAVKVLLDTAGIEYVMPPQNTKETMELGVINSPEFACMPFKTILGDLIYGIEHGADFILFGSGSGQCRFGYYGDVLSEIIYNLDYDVKFVLLETSNITIKGVLDKISPLTKDKKTLDLIKGVLYAARTVFLVDGLNKLAVYTRCREINEGDTDRVISYFHKSVQEATGYKNILKIIKTTKKQLNKIPIDRKFKPLRIAIVGEIYAASHPGINFELERKLGNMGVEVYNNLSLSHWILDHFIKNNLPFKTKNKNHEAGKEFIKTDDIGGHGIQTIGAAITSAKKKFDGVIQIYPFTCMPEIIAQSTLVVVQEKYDIPIMTLIVDEMTGEEGYMTRLEAFIDMLEMRKRQSTSFVSVNF
jgi:predicted nucleotide-binding protein (sugar kinase/HSP70/actin superfamily)